jgi:hypothetical protein
MRAQAEPAARDTSCEAPSIDSPGAAGDEK